MTADAGFEAARARLLAAVETAQGAMGDAVDAAAVYDALLPAGDAERVDGGTLLAHLSVRVAGAQYGPGHRLVGHLRYFRGQRFLDEPGGLLADVPRPPEHPVTDRPP